MVAKAPIVMSTEPSIDKHFDRFFSLAGQIPFSLRTVCSKIIQVLVMILPIFLWFDDQFYLHHAFYKQYNV